MLRLIHGGLDTEARGDEPGRPSGAYAVGRAPLAPRRPPPPAEPTSQLHVIALWLTVLAMAATTVIL